MHTDHVHELPFNTLLNASNNHTYKSSGSGHNNLKKHFTKSFMNNTFLMFQGKVLRNLLIPLETSKSTLNRLKLIEHLF